MTSTPIYRGRFAPSPTGPLHAGSLVAALASWLDARAHGGRWLVRIEDVDTPRTVNGATERILQQLQACGLVSDEPVVLQSQRSAMYRGALDHLVTANLAYPCCCSRKDIANALQHQGRPRARHAELVYPGTCRQGLPPGHRVGQSPCAWRLRTEYLETNWALAPVVAANTAINSVANGTICWHDRRLGPQQQHVRDEVGDFVLQRADGCFTYQLAVVVDDAAQGITHIVRGADLVDNTARQIQLQRMLDLPTPRYLHTPLVLGADGDKLSKQNHAQALDTGCPQSAQAALSQAAGVLGLPGSGPRVTIAESLACWVALWRAQKASAANTLSVESATSPLPPDSFLS